MEEPQTSQGDQDAAEALALMGSAAQEDAAPASRASGSKRKAQAFSQERLQELLQHGGLTAAGEKRLKSGDVRCRPETRYATKYFESGKLPQFRLATAEDAAAAEDCIALWAHVCGHEAELRTAHFRFAPQRYLDDADLIAGLKEIKTPGEMEAFMKNRFGTARMPKRQRTAASAPAAARAPPAQAPEVVVPEEKTAHGYLEMFKDNDVPEERTMLALHHAARNGDAAAVAQLPDAAPTPVDFNASGYQGLTALQHAVASKDVATVECVLARGGNVDAVDGGGKSALHHAAAGGNQDIMAVLLAAGADVNLVDSAGRSALYLATERGNIDIMTALLEAGADVHLRAMDHLPTALHVANKLGNISAAELLTDNGASLHRQRPGFTRGDASDALTQEDLQKSMLERHGLSEAEFCWLLENAAVNSSKAGKTTFTFLPDRKRCISRKDAALEVQRRMAASAAAVPVPGDRPGALGADADASQVAAGWGAPALQLPNPAAMDVDTQATAAASDRQGEGSGAAHVTTTAPAEQPQPPPPSSPAAPPEEAPNQRPSDALCASERQTSVAAMPAAGRELTWAEKYDAAQEAMCAAGRWPADGQLLNFQHRGAGVPAQERVVAKRCADLLKRQFYDPECEEFHQRFLARGFKSEWKRKHHKPSKPEHWLEVLGRWRAAQAEPGGQPAPDCQYDDSEFGLVDLGGWLTRRKYEAGAMPAGTRAAAFMTQVQAVLGLANDNWWKPQEDEEKPRPSTHEEWLGVLQRWSDAQAAPVGQPDRFKYFEDPVFGEVSLGGWLYHRKNEARSDYDDAAEHASAEHVSAAALMPRAQAILGLDNDWWKPPGHDKPKPTVPEQWLQILGRWRAEQRVARTQRPSKHDLGDYNDAVFGTVRLKEWVLKRYIEACGDRGSANEQAAARTLMPEICALVNLDYDDRWTTRDNSEFHEVSALRNGAHPYASVQHAAAGLSANLPGLAPTLHRLLLRAAASDRLDAGQALALLDACRSGELPLSEQAPMRPRAGSVFVLHRKSARVTQDGFAWGKESHTLLKVGGASRVECYYAASTDQPLKRRRYWDKANDDLILIHYLDWQGAAGPTAAPDTSPRKGPSAHASPAALQPGVEVAPAEQAAAAAEAQPAAGAAGRERAAAKRAAEGPPAAEPPPATKVKFKLPLAARSVEPAAPPPAAAPSAAATSAAPPPAPPQQLLGPSTWQPMAEAPLGTASPAAHASVRQQEQCLMAEWGPEPSCTASGLWGSRATLTSGFTQGTNGCSQEELQRKMEDKYGFTAAEFQWLLGNATVRTGGGGHLAVTFRGGSENLHSMAKVVEHARELVASSQGHAGNAAGRGAQRAERAGMAQATAEEQAVPAAPLALHAPSVAAAPPPEPKPQPEQAVKQEAAAGDAPLPAAVPDAVIARLLGADVNSKTSMAGALVALFRAGVGGQAMNRFAMLFSGAKFTSEERQFHFELIRDYVVEGDLAEAARWVKGWFEENKA